MQSELTCMFSELAVPHERALHSINVLLVALHPLIDMLAIASLPWRFVCDLMCVL